MRLSLQKYWLSFLFLLLVAIIDITYSSENDTLTDGRRSGRVSGRIVKLYSGPRPDPVLCLGEGFQKDAVDCSVFYRCLKASNGKYTVYRFQCGPGTVYDPENEVCNYPQRTKRLECGGFDNDRTVSSTERYYDNEIEETRKENQEIPSPITTKPPPNIMDTSIADKFTISYITTRYPWVTTNVQYTESKSTASPMSISTSTKIPGEHVSSQATSYATMKPSSRGDQCMTDGFMGDSEDCQKFYRCVNNQRGGYIRYEFSCSDSTVWDEETQVCNHAWAVRRRRCGRGSSANYVNQNTNNELLQTQISYGSKVPEAQISNRPIMQNQNPINFGDRLNQDKPVNKQNQTQMNYGSTVNQSQNQINYNNKVTQSHLHDYHTTSNSFDNEIEDEVDYGSQNNVQEQQLEPIKSSMETTTSKAIMTTQSLKIHESNCESSGFFGNSNDCSKFYRCVENGRGGFTKYEYRCGDGTLWDPEIESCNHAWSVKQCGNGSQKDIVSVPTSTENTVLTTVSLIQTTTQKDVDEHDYDSGYGSVQRETSHPTTSTERVKYKNNTCTMNGFMGDDHDCKRFYRCVENDGGKFTRHEFTCGEGTVWDPEIEACNHASAVRKCRGIENGDSITDQVTSSYSEAENGVDYAIYNSYNIPIDNDQGSPSPTNTPKSTTVSTTSSTISTAPNKVKQCEKSGFMGDNSDCKIFYRCVENGSGGFNRYEFSCGDGTVWDPKISACNHAWAVENCGGNITENENAEPTKGSTNTITDSTIYTKSTTESITESLSSSTILTSTVSDNSNQCTANGFMGDNNDCRKFYRCVDDGKGSFTRYEFTCSEGTAWDQKIQACNHIWAVDSCANHVSPSIAAENSTTSRPTTMRDDDSNYITQDKENERSTENSSWSTSTVTSTSSSVDASLKCNEEGFIADNHNCKKFYRCTDNGQGGFNIHEFSCGEGTVWNQKLLACDHENLNRQCRTTETHIASSETTVTISTPTSISTTEQPEKTETSLTKDECFSEGFHSSSKDCKKYFRCVDDGKGGFIKYEFTCGEGTVWVQDIQACDHDSDGDNCDCDKNKVTSPTTSHSSSQQTSTLSSSTISTTSTTKPNTLTTAHEYTEGSPKPESSSDDTCGLEGFYPNSKDCTKFYRCVKNGEKGFRKYEFTCSEGTVWDIETQSCNYINQVKRCQMQENQVESQTKPTMQDETVSESSSTTEAHSKATSTTSSENNNNCENSGYFGNTNDCKKFYRCVDDGKGGFTKYDYTCADGTIWDQDITACNHPQDVSNRSCRNDENPTSTTTLGSEQSGTTATSTTSSTTKPTQSTTMTTTTLGSEQSGTTATSTTSSTTKPIQSTTENNSNQSSQASSTNNPNNNNSYTCTEAGYYPDPYDCKKFYRCVDWSGNGDSFSIFHFDCAEGTIWDPAVQTCNHENSVYPPRDCSGTQSQNENGSTTTEGTTSKQEETTNSSTTEGTTSAQTTQKSTTQSSTSTTELASTTDQSTTQQPSTAVQTSSTQKSTTQQSTTAQSTTQKSTTEQSTTQKSTTKQSTTQQSTTQSSTTQQSTTEQSTTQQSTTEQSTTPQSTTEQNTTEQSTTEQSTTPQSTTEQSTTQQSSTEQNTTQQSTTSEQTTTTTTEQSTTSTSTEPTTSTTTEESTTTTAQSTSSESTTSTAEQTTKAEQTTTQESNTEQSSESQSSTTEQSSTTQESTDGSSTTESGQDTTTETESSNNECPQTDSDQYLYACPTGFKRHPKYCNMFYQCTEDDDSHEVKIAVFNCPNNTIYDESKIQCVEEEKAEKKCDGKIAQKRRVKRLGVVYKKPIVVDRQTYSCPTVGHFPFEKNEECSPVMLKCEVTKTGKLRGLVYQCPEGYLYWTISRRCEPINVLLDCKQSFADWTGRHEIPTETKNIARKK